MIQATISPFKSIGRFTDWNPRVGFDGDLRWIQAKKHKIYYYRCLGSDNYRYEGGRVCDNKPIRADYLDEVVWNQVTALLADPALVQAELDRRIDELRGADPATSERSRLEMELSRTTKAIQRLIQAYQEDLVTLEDLRAAIPGLRAKNTSLCNSLETLQAQMLDQDTYLKLAENLESFLTRLRDKATPRLKTANEYYAAWSRRSSWT